VFCELYDPAFDCGLRDYDVVLSSPINCLSKSNADLPGLRQKSPKKAQELSGEWEEQATCPACRGKLREQGDTDTSVIELGRSNEVDVARAKLRHAGVWIVVKEHQIEQIYVGQMEKPLTDGS
jgi:hypothetical protein